MVSSSYLIRLLLYPLIFYISLEEFFLKWLPVSDNIFEALHTFSDLIILLIIFIYFIGGLYRFRFNITNLLWILFISISVLSFIQSYATLFGYFAKLWVLLRYIILYFVLSRITISNQDLTRFYKALYVSFCIQILIGVLQLFDVSTLNNFFQAREGLEKILVQENSIKGTFKFGVFYGYFVMVAFILLYPLVVKRPQRLLSIAGALAFTYLSGSRLVFLGVVGFLVFFHYRENKIFVFLAVFVGILGLVFGGIAEEVENLGSMLGLFSPDFWVNSLATGRLGIFNIVPMFFGADVKELLFGFSYDVGGITSFLYQDYGNLSAILRNNAIVGIEDVYWIAFLYYYGIFGIVLFVAFYVSVFLKMRNLEAIGAGLNHTLLIRPIIYLLVFAFFGAFVNQVFYIKTFSFYFWVFAALASHRMRFIDS